MGFSARYLYRHRAINVNVNNLFLVEFSGSRRFDIAYKIAYNWLRSKSQAGVHSYTYIQSLKLGESKNVFA